MKEDSQPISKLIETDQEATNHSQMQMLLTTYLFDMNLNHFSKTYFIYNIYNRVSDAALKNLHTFAIFLSDPSLQLVIKKNSYSIASEASQHINKHQYLLHMTSKESENIWIYENITSSTRVVALPFKDNIADIKKAEKFNKDLQDKIYKRNQQAKKLQGEALKAEKQKINKQKQVEIKNFEDNEKERWLKIFQIECVINSCLKKTDKVSLCGIANLSQGRLKKYIQQSNILFSLPNIDKLQFIVHSCSEESEKQPDLNNKQVSTIITLTEDEQIKFIRKNMYEQRYFWDHSMNFRTNLLSSQTKNNEAINKITKQFIDSWRQTAKASLCCFGVTVKQVLGQLNPSIQLQSSYNISQIEKAFHFSQLELPSLIKIDSFYSRSRLKSIFKNQEIGQKQFKIPQSIKQIVFGFFLEKICRKFLEGDNDKIIKYGRDQTPVLDDWKIFLKEVNQLCFSISKIDHTKKQKYFDFVCFILKSTEKIKQILNQETSLSSFLKSALKRITPPKDIAQKYIIQNMGKFNRQQELNYYNLLLLMIKSSHNVKKINDLKYIECHLLELKAFNIASKHISDNKKIVQAIRCYAHILLQYPHLDPNNRKHLNISQDQKRIARLLTIVGLSNISVDIYFKNQMLNQANKACKEARKDYQGDQRAEKLIQWAKKFMNQLQYELAMNYLRDAYDCAHSLDVCQKVIKNKLECNSKKKQVESEDILRPFEKFVSPDTKSKDEFTSQTSMNSTYKRLQQFLEWDEKAQIAWFNQKEQENKQSDFLGISSYELN